ncbi:MAG: restriction endonuclease subunit S [Crocosphaera sp.]
MGNIPSHWEVEKIKYCALINQNTLPENTDPNYTFNYVDISSVTQGKINKVEPFIFRKAPSRARRIAKLGDTIVSTVRTYLKAIAYIDKQQYQNIYSTGFCVISPLSEKTNKKYFSYFLQSELFINQVVSCSKGVSFPAITPSELSNFPIVLPNFEEQQKIAKFLDEKTAEIEEAISYKQRLIELLQEQKAILINQSVTKGLNPNVPMRDSGIEWLGDIPEHWEVCKIKFATTIFRGKFTHRPRNDPRLYDGQYPFIQTGDVAKAGKYITEYKQTLNENGLKVSTLIPKETVVITIAANIGDISILSFDACFPDSIVGFSPKENLDRDFLYYILVSMKQEFMNASTKNTQMNLNIERIGANFITVPPLIEQKIIINYLDKKTEETNEAIYLIQKQIDQLNELKQILISNAVTGKIKVL